MRIVVKNVSKKINDHKILSSINFELFSGEIVALTGPNGSGKTTLLSIIAGDTDYDGDIIMNDLKVGFVGHSPFLYNYLTVSETFTFIKKMWKENNEWHNKNFFIAKLNLEKFSNVLVKDLSLGTQQKVAIALNLFLNPNVLLLDEPFVNLDQYSRYNLRQLLTEFVNQKNRAVLMTTHSSDPELLNIIKKRITLHN